MRYTSMIVGFVLATLTAVGSSEPANYVNFSLPDIVRSKTFHVSIFEGTYIDDSPADASLNDGRGAAAPLWTPRGEPVGSLSGTWRKS